MAGCLSAGTGPDIPFPVNVWLGPDIHRDQTGGTEMMKPAFALCYAALASLPFMMHIALAAGAPFGRFTVGGRFSGRLPPLWRGLAVIQAAILAGMAIVVLDRGGVLSVALPSVLFWPVEGITLLTFLANAASPSQPERRLWTPVTLGMLLSATGLIIL